MIFREYISPAGCLMLGAAGGKLLMCDWTGSRRHGRNMRKLTTAAVDMSLSYADSAVLDEAEAQLVEYFSGTRREFSLDIAFCGTPFQKAVWRELMKIPYGMTVDYAGLSERVGRPSAVRAVANAVGANTVSIIVPCHRVVGRDGSLTGYAGGIRAKRVLLTLENPLLVNIGGTGA